MPRYIDADKLLNSLTMTDFVDWSDYDIFHHFVTNAPTADVVPKSEYDKLDFMLTGFHAYWCHVLCRQVA